MTQIYNAEDFNYEDLLDLDFLTPQSIVFDIASNVGIWAEQVYNKYHPQMYCFEPQTFPYNILLDKFKDNKDFHLYKFGLGKENRIFKLYLTNDIGNDASEFLESKRQRMGNSKLKTEDCIIKETMQFLKDSNITHIDLMALNCEGGEYELLEYLIDNDYLHNISNFLISFHTPLDGVKIMNIDKRINNITTELNKTHECKWVYPRMWEKWVLK